MRDSGAAGARIVHVGRVNDARSFYLLGFASKVTKCAWTQSVPPAVAGGYEVESARFANVL